MRRLKEQYMGPLGTPRGTQGANAKFVFIITITGFPGRPTVNRTPSPSGWAEPLENWQTTLPPSGDKTHCFGSNSVMNVLEGSSS